MHSNARYARDGLHVAVVGDGVSGLSAACLLSRRHRVGIHYALRLARWREAFRGRLDEVRALGFDERFIRMWDDYLAACQAYFATRRLGDLQLVLTRPGNPRLLGVPARRSVAA